MPLSRRHFTKLLLVAPLAAAGCGDGGSGSGGSTEGGPPVRVSAGGATFVDPIMRAWAKDYRKAKKTEIDYIKSGSGKGISDVTAKTIDFGCTDAPMSKKEYEAAKAAGGDVLHIPVTMGAVAIVYNLPGVEKLNLTGPVLADIYLGKVAKWNDKAIADLNAGATLPDKAIVAVRRAESSGTTNIFSEYLSKVSGEFKEKVGTTKEMKLTGGVGQQGNDGIAGFVKNNAGAIGYVELAYANKNQIPTALLKNKAGKAVGPNADSVTAAAAAAMGEKPTAEPYTLHDLTFSLTDAAGDASYPIVGISYAILFAKQSKDKGPAVVDFLKWVVADGQKLATELDYAPLPADLGKKAQAKLDGVTFE
jgi:phosphate transport system substrate-binding protein